MRINEIFEKYKHMDKPLSDEGFAGRFEGRMLYEFWQAIKGAATEQAAPEEDATADLLATLSWMSTDINFRRSQTGMDPAPLSPEMELAGKLLEDLRAGRIECRRNANA